jgi:hypothetical protein
MADLISEELRLSPTEANEVRWGAFLHDIGKLLVPAEILNKTGAPTPREWTILHRHPAEGARLVEPLRPFLQSGVDAVGAHHEHYDGSGYPLHLSGEQIPLVARIVAVADSFEVMTAVRSYKRPMSAQAARAELVRNSGTQFDPRVVRAFLNVPLGRLHWALGIVAWVTEIPFLTVIPRAAAQMSAVTGGGTVLSTSALSSIATASLGAIVAAGPSVAHAEAALSASPPPTTSVPAPSDHVAPTSRASSAAGGASSENPAHPSSLTQTAGSSVATGVTSPQPSTSSIAGSSNESASLSVGSTPPTAALGSGQAVAPVGKGAANSNAGGKGAANSNAGGNGAANANAGDNGAANSNAGGNGNGAANSNAGGNGNGAANSNAGGNGNGAANSNAGSNGNGHVP